MRDLTGQHDEDPEALAGSPVEYDWRDDPDDPDRAQEVVDDGDPDPVSGQAS